MTKFSSVMFFCTFALMCTAVMALVPSAVAVASSPSPEKASSLSSSEYSTSLSSSSFSLPSLSDIMSTLLDDRRNLQAEKFASLNQIFDQVSIELPDAKVSSSGLDLTISQLVCGNLNVRDIQLSHNVESNTSQRLDVDLTGVKISCSFHFEYKWSFFDGSGSGTGVLDPSSSVGVGVQFVSENFGTRAPHDATVKDCNPVIKIKDLDLDMDGIIGGIVNLFEGTLKDTVQGELADLVCTELRGKGDDALDDLMLMISSRMDMYLEPLDESLANPLLLENTTQVPKINNGENIGAPLYLNFQELEEYAGGWIDSALDQVNSLLGPSESEPSGQPRVNNFIRDNFLDLNGKVVVDPSLISSSGVIFEVHDVLTQTTMSIKSIQIEGLDSINKIDLLNDIGKHTLQNKLKLDYLHIVAEMEAEMAASTLDDAVIVANSSPPIKEQFTIDFTVSGVEIDTSIFLGINTETLGNLELGSVLHSQNILPCLLSAVDDAKFTGFSVSVTDMNPPELSGFMDAGMDYLMSMGSTALFDMYEQLLIKATPNFFEIYVRDAINIFINNALDGYDCPTNADVESDHYVDFRDLLLPSTEAALAGGSGDERHGDVMPWVMNLAAEQLLSADEEGELAINNLLASFAERQSNEDGDIFFPGHLFKQDLDIALNGLNAEIELGISDLRVSNIGSIGAPIKLLQPVKGESSLLDNAASIGVGSNALRTELRFLMKAKGDDVEVHNDLVLGLSLENVGMVIQVLAQIEELAFLNFPLRDVLNLQCWVATVVAPILDKHGIRVGGADSGMVLKNIALAVAEARLHIECISCSSPLIVEMASKLGSREAVADTTAAANMIFEYISNLLEGSFVQSQVDLIINEAAMKCPHSPSYNQNFAGLKYDEMDAIQKDEDAYGFLIAIIAVIAISAAFAVIIVVAAKCVSRRRHNRWLRTLTRAQKLDIEEMQSEEKERENDLNVRMKSLVRSTEVPLFIRLVIPLVILGNIALFLSGHLSLGGTVNISGSFAGQSFSSDGFFEFSMAKSTVEMWNAGAKSLAIMIVIFSGVWPYTKLLTTLLIWFTPPRWLSSKRRGSILHWLDVLGKWSMVDVFVLLMTLASFRLSVESPDQLSFLPRSLYSINMLVVPLWGLYANMLAQLVAQISSHVIIHYHRKTVRSATGAQEVEMNLAPLDSGKALEKLRLHRFKLDYEASSKHATVKRSVHWILSAALLLFTTLVVCGCALPSFSIEVLGLVGLAVESGNQFQQANVFYSVFDLASMIMDQGRYLNTADLVGLGTLASLLMITVFIVPLFQAASLLAQWFAPMTKKQRLQNTVLNEILSAWQYMEVYVLSIVISAWQLGGVSEYMINAYCDSLKETFASLAYHGILREEDAQCFRVNASVEAASWILVAASLILYILNHFIVGASSQKAQDDDTPSDQRFYSDRWLQDKQSTATINMTMSDEEDGTEWLDLKEPSVSPVKPRFTDYFFFVTRHGNEEPEHNDVVESAVLPVFEIGEE